jgi:hypothetical protein
MSYFAMRRTGNAYMARKAIAGQLDVPAGSFVTGLSLTTGDFSIAYSYLQFYWNGTYYTVSG